VVCADGHSYERAALEHWVHTLGHSTSPLTGQQFPGLAKSIVANHALRKQVEAWRESTGKPYSDSFAASSGRNDSTVSEENSAEQEDMLQIFCRTDMGKMVPIWVWPSTSVQELKLKLQTHLEIPAAAQTLRWGATVLMPSRRLVDLGVGNLSTVNVEVDLSALTRCQASSSFEGDSERMLAVHIDGATLAVPATDSVEDLMFRYWCRAPTGLQHDRRPSQLTFWKDMRNVGDGYFSGTCLCSSQFDSQLASLVHHDSNSSRKLELVCKPRYQEKHEKRHWARVEVAKAMFDAFINRSEAYHYASEMGLMLFGGDVNTKKKLSPFYEDFRKCVEHVQTEGGTKLFDCVDQAAHQLEEWLKKQRLEQPESPMPLVRILVLSDGQDTESTQPAWKIARRLQRSQITLDAVMIGSSAESDRQLHGIAKATGGYVFQPQSLADALRLNELEVMLSGTERPPRGPLQVVSSAAALSSFCFKPGDRCDADHVPAKKTTSLMAARTCKLQDALSSSFESEDGQTHEVMAQDNQEKEISASQQRRLLHEMRRLHRDPHPSVEVFPGEENLRIWKLVMEGPAGTPYQGGAWLLSCHFPCNYPNLPPEVRFVTPIRHCNVNAYGRICHSILERNYTADTSVLAIVQCIFGLLLNPDYDDPLDSTLALEFYQGSGTYEDSIRCHVAKHANRTRAEWSKLLEENDGTDLAQLACLASRAEGENGDRRTPQLSDDLADDSSEDDMEMAESEDYFEDEEDSFDDDVDEAM